MKLLGRKRIVISAAAAGAVIVGSTSAFAYFTSTGTATGSASVGQATNFSVTSAGNDGGTIYPGSTTGEVLSFTVTNVGKGDQEYSHDATAVLADNGNVLQNGTPVPGCKANWFNAAITSDPDLGTLMAANATETVKVTVTMPTDATDNQDKCQNVNPDVALTVSK